jgi:hypothetical protein
MRRDHRAVKPISALAWQAAEGFAKRCSFKMPMRFERAAIDWHDCPNIRLRGEAKFPEQSIFESASFMNWWI